MSNLRDFFIFIMMAIVFINWLVGFVQCFSCRSPVLSLDLFMVFYDFISSAFMMIAAMKKC